MDKPKKEKKEKKSKYPEIEPEEPELPMKLKKSKKHKRSSEIEETEAQVDQVLLEVDHEVVSEKPKKDKKKKHREIEEPIEEEKPQKSKKHKRTVETEEVFETPTKKIKTVVAEENDWEVPVTTPKYWHRIDESKYMQSVQGTKFADNSHYVKGGDAWGNDAADRLGKVKGRGFKKEMSKLKRASWKGCGSIDTGVNSVQFSDWED